MSLHERITAALDGTTPGPWGLDHFHVTPPNHEGGTAPVALAMVATTRPIDESDANARLIAEAPGLLAECARRLNPGDNNVRDLVMRLRHLDKVESEHDGCRWGANSYEVLAAADLLEQAFLDPKETP